MHSVIDIQGAFLSTTTENVSFFKCTRSSCKINECWTAKQDSAAFPRLKSHRICSLDVAKLHENTSKIVDIEGEGESGTN